MNDPKSYCNSLFSYSRWKTREVVIGSVKMGGQHPILVQSMTTCDTMDIKGTVAESVRMIEAGCKIVRITAPSKKEAEALQQIKAELLKRGHDTPLVADIHFTPNAAEVAADYVEKIRVNPGNYADKKKFEHHEYSDAGYQAELDRIRARFTPLVLKCKQLGRAMRIGTNHGSLSDRILSRYGDTPEGMVASAMEFIEICRDNDFHNLVISMKASNTLVMVQAYRLVVHEMMKRGMNYPLHLGVTEAGEGEDGRIKSAVGMGALLEDGLGDTIRVSLTEAPEAEIPVAQKLLKNYVNRSSAELEPETCPIDPFSFSRRNTRAVGQVGDHHVPCVVVDISHKEDLKPANLFGLGYHYAPGPDKWNISDLACDFIYVGKNAVDIELPGTLGVIQDAEFCESKPGHYPLFDSQSGTELPSSQHFLTLTLESLTPEWMEKMNPSTILLLSTSPTGGMAEQRTAVFRLINRGLSNPVVVRRSYHTEDSEEFMLHAAADTGALFLDGLADGIFLQAPKIAPKIINETSFGILQATRTRISKTEYISCPSCGRTLFDLQETTAQIRARTGHLKGLKIGIMGCIVNGPGEMADADYGYVGTGPGKITLYKEREVIKRHVPESDAVDELIDLIKSYGDWQEEKQS